MNIEPLETRIAPASAFVVYTDIDGDLVKITVATPGAAAPVLTAADLTFTDGNPDGQLARLDLTDASLQGASVAFAVTKKPGGDGFAHVGRIDATGRDLGVVVVKGDLGAIDAGNVGAPAIKSLSLQSMGAFGTATGAVANGDGTIKSTIRGGLGAIAVKGDVEGVWLHVTEANGTIGAITIGGSLVGRATLRSGSIQAAGDIGPVKIGRSLIGGAGDESGKIDAGGVLTSLTVGGSIRGGAGDYDTSTDTNAVLHSGQVFAIGDIGAVKIARDVIPAPFSNDFSAVIHSRGALGGSVTVGGTLAAPLVGDAGIGAVKIGRNAEADITSGGALASLTVGADASGAFTATGAMGLVKIGRDLGGTLDAGTTLAGVTVGGSVRGQPTLIPTIESGGQMGLVKIAADVDGNLAIKSGGGLTGVIVGGGILRESDFSFVTTITSAGDIGLIKVGRDAVLGTIISTTGGLGTLSIGGTYFVDQLTLAGELGRGKVGAFHGRLNAAGGIGTLQIGGDVANGSSIIAAGGVANLSIGGNGFGSYALGDTTKLTIKGSLFGLVQSGGTLGAVTIGGDLHGGITTTGDITALTLGGSFLTTEGGGFGARVAIDGRLGALKIGGDIVGPNLTPGEVFNLSFPLIGAGSIGSVAIGGSVFAGIDDSNVGALTGIPMISSGHEIGSVAIKGDLRGTVGSGGDVTPALILAANQVTGFTTNLAIGKVTIGGTVERAGIHAGAGVFPFMIGTNGNASIGAVNVGGDWIASNLTAGVRDPNGNSFGNADDDVVNAPAGAEADAIIAKIASISIRGVLAGSSIGTDQFGFVAQEIGVLKYAGRTVVLTPGKTNDSINLVPFTNDVQLNEI